MENRKRLVAVWLGCMVLCLLNGCRDRTPLPEKYDGRQAGRTAPIRDQGDTGACWAFAALQAMENRLLPEESWDFSEEHMASMPYFLQEEQGGDYVMSMAYLLSWQGPVGRQVPSRDERNQEKNLIAEKHVQEIQLLPEKDLQEIKEAVLEYGGVQSSLYMALENGEGQSEYYDAGCFAYCYPLNRQPNHDVVIVGWDDAFPGEAFASAGGNGAFLCANSWGTQFGDAGFFYVSYYDSNLGKDNLVYSRVESPDNYDCLYQTDLCGWIGQLGYEAEAAWACNVYEAERPQQLEAVGFYATGPGTDYQVYVVRAVPQPLEMLPEKRLAAEGHLDVAGFYTIDLPSPEPLEAGERFAVMVRLKTPEAMRPIAVEYDAGDGRYQIDLDDGEGYISPDGVNWERAETAQQCNVCLKAYASDR